MNPAAARLPARVLVWQLAFSAGSTGGVALGVPRLLLLNPTVGPVVSEALLVVLAAATVLTLARSWWILRRQRYVLRSLALGSRSVEPIDMLELTRAPARLTTGWVFPLGIACAVFATPLRPALLDLSTGASVALLGLVVVCAVALPLHVVVRAAVLAALELAPPDVMRDVLESAARTGAPKRRLTRRLVIAVATPVALVAIGAASVTNAHSRRADERHREDSARALARAALELGPGVIERAGIREATVAARSLGFYAKVRDERGSYGVTRSDDGIVTLTTPLDSNLAIVRFAGSTVQVLSLASLIVMLLAMAAAALLGASLGRALNRDLVNATRGVRLLGTDAVIGGGTRLVQPARFRIVAELGSAVEKLAERFHVFAQAQERAIDAREAATRMRGLFFASVSHDLKSPLNAILGFTELVRQEPLTAEQLESLDLIQKRGRELLALIEAILDAARVEAGQLSLVTEDVDVADLVWNAVDKGRDLGGERALEVAVDVPEGLPPLQVDRVRVGRAVAMFIGHSVRTAERAPVRVTVTPQRDSVVIEVEVPSTRFSAEQLGAMLDPSGAGQPGASENRGLALGLSLARSVIELNGGRVDIVDHGPARAAFRVTLTRAGRLSGSIPPGPHGTGR